MLPYQNFIKINNRIVSQ